MPEVGRVPRVLVELDIMGAEKVFASTVGPGWKSSQADRPGKESVPISDPNSAKSQEIVRVIKANPESIVEVCKPASVPSLADERVCDANPMSRVIEPEASMRTTRSSGTG
jgi:hypothetical protein